MIHDDSFKIAESTCKKREERIKEEDKATKNMRVRERDQEKTRKSKMKMSETTNKQNKKPNRKESNLAAL